MRPEMLAMSGEAQADRSSSTPTPSAWLARSAGIVAVGLGGTVLIGWYVGIPALIQVRPNLVPMQHNTALGFVLCGAGLTALAIGRRRATFVCALLALALATATLAEYAWGLNLGIDELFLRAYITVATRDPGRMAPMTAVSFMLCAAGLLMALTLAKRYRGVTVAAVASLVVGLGSATFVGYGGGRETPFEWQHPTYMAVHTAVGFVVLGAGLGAVAWSMERRWRPGTPPWLAGPAGVLLATLTVMLWQSLLADERYRLSEVAQREAQALRFQVAERIALHTGVMNRAGERWARRNGMSRNDWEADAATLLRDLAGFSTVLRIDRDYRLQWIVPEPETGSQPGLSLAGNDAIRAALDRFRARGEVSITRTLSPRRRAFFIVVPLSVDGAFDGFMAVAVVLDELLSDAVESARSSGFGFEINEAGEQVFATGPEPVGLVDSLRAETSVDVQEVDWVVRTWPEEGLIEGSHTALPRVSLLVGLVLSALAFSTVALGQLAARRAVETQRANEALQGEVNERREAQQELQRLAATLEEKVRERTREIDASRADALRQMEEARAARGVAEETKRALAQRNLLLAQANEDLKQFAYVASHDLQEPLRMVASYVQLLEQRYGDKLDEDARDFIAFAVDGATRMKQLINDLLQYSRVETQGAAFAPTDMEEVLGDVLGNLRLAIGESGADVTHDRLPTIEADRPQLSILLQNLVGNAIKFRAAGRAPKVHVSAEEYDGGWRFGVRDNGIGIEPEYFERVFVIFQRLHTRAEYPGTGIGLAVCQRIVRRHGGTIRVESTPGEGATFFFTLPRVRDAEDEDVHDDGAADRDLAG